MMKVRLVCYEDVNKWILGKFALRMKENLLNLNIDVEIDNVPDPLADINHHIYYFDYNGKKNSIDTLMITHIDDIDKFNLLKQQMQVAEAGICMSSETMNNLSQLGINKNKLCYINPAHDGIIPLQKIVIGLACRIQPDGRKREYFLDNLANVLDPRYFHFKIIGDNWDNQVNNLKRKGFTVEYHINFEYDKYIEFIPSLDYYLYTGLDEGQMGFVDAVAAGVKTIVTRQGYHMDAPDAVVYPFITYEELEKIMLSLQYEKMKLTNSLSTWNWYDYTKKHLEIWDFLLNRTLSKSRYVDGLNSLLDKRDKETDGRIYFKMNKSNLIKSKYKRQYYIFSNRITGIIRSVGVTGLLNKSFRKFKGYIYNKF